MPLPIDLRKRPVSVKVNVSRGEGVDITWSDGHSSRYDFSYLRDHCPCALCNEERAKRERLGASAKTGGAVLPMFKPRVKAKAATAVGSYAIQIDFTDGHATGIFSFEHLREICPCEACQRDFRTSGGEAPM